MGDIRIAQPHDEEADAVAAILADGFSEDPVMQWVFEDNDKDRALFAFFRFLMAEVVIPSGATYVLDGDAAAAWTPPEPDPWPEERTAAFVSMMVDVATLGALERVSTLDEQTRAVHPQIPHWYLGILAARCAVQGKGAGSELMTRCLARVDEDGLPAYLESSNERNVPFYERHGFRVTGRIDLPAGPPLFPMWRDTQGAR
jgi:ribosomal protein S18 acetylase RimI-like enzyme